MSVLKSLFAVSLTGASSVGGTLIYQTAVPGSWKDVLIKEGYFILETEDYYKAIYEDHKEKLLKEIQNFKDDNDLSITTALTKLKPWCDKKLAEPYKWNAETKKHLVSLCTLDGIITVKARLISIGKSSFIIDEAQATTQDKQYKIVFAIYRYSERLINFFKLWKNETITKDTKVNDGYTKLKEACKELLKKPHKEVTDPRYLRHASWWCKKFEYETFDDLAKHRDKSWEVTQDANGKPGLWKHTEQAMKYIKPAEEGQEVTGRNVTDEEIKEWCETNKNTSFDDNESYQEKFLVFFSVCKKNPNQQPPS